MKFSAQCWWNHRRKVYLQKECRLPASTSPSYLQDLPWAHSTQKEYPCWRWLCICACKELEGRFIWLCKVGQAAHPRHTDLDIVGRASNCPFSKAIAIIFVAASARANRINSRISSASNQVIEQLVSTRSSVILSIQSLLQSYPFSIVSNANFQDFTSVRFLNQEDTLLFFHCQRQRVIVGPCIRQDSPQKAPTVLSTLKMTVIRVMALLVHSCNYS